MVLPYIEGSNSGLVGTAYFFHKPVIVTRVGALPEYVVEGETGWVIPAADARALADTLCHALSDTARLARMGDAGRDWYDQARASETAVLDGIYQALVRRT
jgi:glycosyltransferase involved in cell wall biosynthesis